MNLLSATGNVGGDAEVRFTKDGTAIANFSFALSSGYGDKRKTSWVRCSIIGKRGETLAPMLTKGTQIAINGEVSLNEYVAKDGTNKTTLECLVSNVTLLGKKDQSSAPSKPAPSKTKEQDNSGFDSFEDDIPF
jgi:single-strand DNA-binding protein